VRDTSALFDRVSPSFREGIPLPGDRVSEACVGGHELGMLRSGRALPGDQRQSTGKQKGISSLTESGQIKCVPRAKRFSGAAPWLVLKLPDPSPPDLHPETSIK
jgi:hypothetical protein